MRKKYFRSVFFILMIFGISTTYSSFAQKSYEFNRTGNDCFIQFICYKQDNDYESRKHPFIFVLGKPEETAHDKCMKRIH